MPEKKGTRDALRSKLLGGRKRATKLMEIKPGVEIEIRQPSVGARSKIMKAAGMSAGTQDVTDLGALQIAAVVNCCFVPGTNERLFDVSDSGALEELPTADWFDAVSAAALDLMNAEPEAAGKP